MKNRILIASLTTALGVCGAAMADVFKNETRQAGPHWSIEASGYAEGLGPDADRALSYFRREGQEHVSFPVSRTIAMQAALDFSQGFTGTLPGSLRNDTIDTGVALGVQIGAPRGETYLGAFVAGSETRFDLSDGRQDTTTTVVGGESHYGRSGWVFGTQFGFFDVDTQGQNTIEDARFMSVLGRYQAKGSGVGFAGRFSVMDSPGGTGGKTHPADDGLSLLSVGFETNLSLGQSPFGGDAEAFFAIDQTAKSQDRFQRGTDLSSETQLSLGYRISFGDHGPRLPRLPDLLGQGGGLSLD